MSNQINRGHVSASPKPEAPPVIRTVCITGISSVLNGQPCLYALHQVRRPIVVP